MVAQRLAHDRARRDVVAASSSTSGLFGSSASSLTAPRIDIGATCWSHRTSRGREDVHEFRGLATRRAGALHDTPSRAWRRSCVVVRVDVSDRGGFGPSRGRLPS
jgi:hypothetical protein